MPNLIKNEKEHLIYLSLYDRTELEYVLREENKLRVQEKLPLLTIHDIENKEIIVSKKGNIIDGYSIINLTLDENNDVKVIIERLYEQSKDDIFLHNELFEASMFVAVEKVNLMQKENGEIPKIISSSLVIEGRTINFNITEQYAKRNLNMKFDKEAVKKKIELDEQYKIERETLKNKISANTFYNETGHRFHSMVDEKNNNKLAVVENDFDTLSLDQRLILLQQQNINKDKTLDEVYIDFAKEKIDVELVDDDLLEKEDFKKIDEAQKDFVTAASIIDKTDDFKIDVENGIAFDKDNKRINLKEKKEASEKLGNNIMFLASRGYSREKIENVLKKDNVEWNKLSVEDKERILNLYGVNDNNIAKENIQERNIDVHNSKELDPQVKKLVLKNDQVAYVSYVIISFISGLSAGIFITLLLMFLRE